MTRATLLHEGFNGVMTRLADKGDLDKYLTNEVVHGIAARHRVSRIQAGMAYLGLVQHGLTRACALGWVVVDAHRFAQGSLTRFDAIEAWWVTEWADVPWREHGWLLHAAGVTSRDEQEALWRKGLDRQMLLSMAALRGYVIPAILSRPITRRPKNAAG